MSLPDYGIPGVIYAMQILHRYLLAILFNHRYRNSKKKV